jgi:hypothetical protein
MREVIFVMLENEMLWVEEVIEDSQEKTYTVGCWGLDGDC